MIRSSHRTFLIWRTSWVSKLGKTNAIIHSVRDSLFLSNSDQEYLQPWNSPVRSTTTGLPMSEISDPRLRFKLFTARKTTDTFANRYDGKNTTTLASNVPDANSNRTERVTTSGLDPTNELTGDSMARPHSPVRNILTTYVVTTRNPPRFDSFLLSADIAHFERHPPPSLMAVSNLGFVFSRWTRDVNIVITLYRDPFSK